MTKQNPYKKVALKNGFYQNHCNTYGDFEPTGLQGLAREMIDLITNLHNKLDKAEDNFARYSLYEDFRQATQKFRIKD